MFSGAKKGYRKPLCPDRINCTSKEQAHFHKYAHPHLEIEKTSDFLDELKSTSKKASPMSSEIIVPRENNEKTGIRKRVATKVGTTIGFKKKSDHQKETVKENINTPLTDVDISFINHFGSLINCSELNTRSQIFERQTIAALEHDMDNDEVVLIGEEGELIETNTLIVDKGLTYESEPLKYKLREEDPVSAQWLAKRSSSKNSGSAVSNKSATLTHSEVRRRRHTDAPRPAVGKQREGVHNVEQN
eukprot:TRINITY_DN10195_c0_g1_i1.p1 TRINITY_DN10195_c0_g1~~TRINITY_DN10195_c0_g1_i1.p1  ORF type:complete len:246 (+),score=42.16 TRINITY_DN10195_c0_g1_i1:49-786(+)